MSKKQTLNLRQAGNNTIDISLATPHGYSPSKTFAQSHPYSWGIKSCFQKPSLRCRYKQCTKSCFLNQPLHWRYKQLLSKSIPTLMVQTVAL